MNRLREIRDSKGMTQLDVAQHIGVNRSSYANYESGRREVDHETLIKLADLFNVSVDYILCRNEKQPTVENDGLRTWTIDRVAALSDPELLRVRDFLAGLEAGQEIGSAPAAAPDPDAEPPE